jgi:TPR repeat protein
MNSLSKSVLLLLALIFSLLGCHRYSISANSSLRAPASDDLRCTVAHVNKKFGSVDILREASERGNSTCQVLLGDLYEHGLGVTQDIPHAKSLYLSAAQTDMTAYFYLGHLAEEGIGEPVDYRMARNFYRISATGIRTTTSNLKLAQLLEDGKGGPVDLQGAMDLYVGIGDYNKTARDGIHRLYALGARLSDDQKDSYLSHWATRSVDSLISKISGECNTLLRPQPSAADLKSVKIQIKYIPGSLLPKIKLLESSNDNDFEQRILHTINNYKFPYEPLPESS